MAGIKQLMIEQYYIFIFIIILFHTNVKHLRENIYLHIGLFFNVREILPWVQGEFRFDKMDNLVEKFSSAETEIRALVEGQFIAKRAHAEDLGFRVGKKYFLGFTAYRGKN